jgi:hypothetical protein
MRDQKPTRLTATADAVKVPKERTQEEHRYIVWMNYSDLFKDRDEFEAACDGYEARKNRRKEPIDD